MFLDIAAFFLKKMHFLGRKRVFSKSLFYTKMFSDPNYNVSVRQKNFFAVLKNFKFFIILNLAILFLKFWQEISKVQHFLWSLYQMLPPPGKIAAVIRIHGNLNCRPQSFYPLILIFSETESESESDSTIFHLFWIHQQLRNLTTNP